MIHSTKLSQQRCWIWPGALVLVLAVGLLTVACSGPTPTLTPEAGTASDVGAGPATAGAAPAVTAVTAAAPAAPVSESSATATPAPPTATSSPTTMIFGQVMNPDGQPIVDAAVAVVEGTVPLPRMSVFTDATGRYQWIVRPGTFTVEVYRDDYATQRAEVSVAEGQAAELNFTLEPK